MKSILLPFFALCTIISFGQFTVTENTDATLLAQQLAGVGVTISNATLVCPSGFNGESFSGSFANANVGLGISDGVLLTTGVVTNVNDVNGSTAFVSEDGGGLGDTDLNNLLTSLGETYTTNDACILEFDIDVIGDTLRFNYSMGSEEYPDFVCGVVNDIFGFFISGPNPGGGNYVNENIALIPGTNLPVSINTVNNGGSGAAVTCYDGTYSNFMNPNPSPISSVPNIAYNQVTGVLEAKAATVPCAQYHFKLAIADGGDFVYDSGVFLEAGSFSSTGVIVAASSILGAGFNTMVENCIDGEIEFTLEAGQNTTGSPIAIPYSFSGSATHLVDFVQIPFGDTAYVLPGDASTTIQLISISDNIAEGVETIEINVEGECGSIIASTIDISDVIPFNVAAYNSFICIGESIDFEVTGAQNYTWSPSTFVSNPNSGTTTITPTTSTTYTVSYTLGNCSEDTTFTINVSNLTVNSFSTNETCPNDDDGTAYATHTGSAEVVSFLWDDGSTDSLRTNLNAGTYCVTISEENGCEITLCEEITQPDLTINLFAFPNTICNNEVANLNVLSNLSPNASFSWSPANLVADPNAAFQTNTVNLTTQTTFTVSAIDQGCTISDEITIFVSDFEATINVTDVSCNDTSDGALDVIVSGENGGPFFFWDNGTTNSSLTNLNEGTYCVEVSDFDCLFNICEDINSGSQLNIDLTADDTTLCNENSTNIYVNSNISNGTYTWSPPINFSNINKIEENTAINLQNDTYITVSVVDENNCEIEDSILISAKVLVVNPNFSDTTVESGTNLDIGVSVVNASNLNESVSFTWSPTRFLTSTTSQNTTTTPTESILYTISSQADNCTDLDSIMVYINIELEMPNAFTPNADGLNDVYKPILKGADILEFRIYDRWGKLLHDDKNNAWDGKFKAKEQKIGLYNYYLKLSNGQEEISRLGSFTLIR